MQQGGKERRVCEWRISEKVEEVRKEEKDLYTNNNNYIMKVYTFMGQ